MRTFLNHIKNETLDEIKTSLENVWQQMIQLSEFFQYSFVLILKRKCLVRASRVRSGESGTPSTIIYVRWSSQRYELGCDTPVVETLPIKNVTSHADSGQTTRDAQSPPIICHAPTASRREATVTWRYPESDSGVQLQETVGR